MDAKNGGQYALWVSQLNATYTPLYDIDNYTASAKQPDGCVFGDNTAPIFNDTMLVSLPVITYLTNFAPVQVRCPHGRQPICHPL